MILSLTFWHFFLLEIFPYSPSSLSFSVYHILIALQQSLVSNINIWKVYLKWKLYSICNSKIAVGITHFRRTIDVSIYSKLLPLTLGEWKNT